MFLPRGFFLFLGALALGGASVAQTRATAPRPTTVLEGMPSNIVARIEGRVLDLARGTGFLVYSTQEGEVGRVVPGDGHGPTVLGSPATGLPNALFGVAVTPSGDVAALNGGGDVWIVPGGGGPAFRLYADTYMIQDARDLIVDAAGNFLIASKTPSSGVRAINHVSFDGQRWAYWLVRHQPLALAWDPQTDDLLFTDQAGGGALRSASTSDGTRPTALLDGSTQPFPSVGGADGDLAIQANGDILWIAGNTLWRHVRGSGTSSPLATGFDSLRGVAISASSGLLPSFTGWSAYVADGEYPTRIREVPNVGAPAPVTAPDQGYVLAPGRNLGINPGFQMFDLAVDNQGNLLAGGGLWNTFFFVKRITLPFPSVQDVASDADGLSGMIEGVAVAPDDTIYAISREGTIHAITEGPLSVTDVYTDPGDQIAAAKDMALGADGSFYIAERSGWGWGKLFSLSGGVLNLLSITDETRGVAARPGGGLYVSQWHGTGFEGTVSEYSFLNDTLTQLPGFETMNYTNDSVWGDGDLVVDALGRVYTVSEDDWSLVRYTPGQVGFERIGSGYLDHPSGLAIAPSSANAGSSTGWSLYISEFGRIWEQIDMPGPAGALVDEGLPRLGAVVGTLHPRHGRPEALRVRDGVLQVLTAGGALLELDPRDGQGRVLREGRARRDGLRRPRWNVPRAVDRHGRLVAARPAEGRLMLLDPRDGVRRPLSGNHLQVNALAFGPASDDPEATSLYVIDGWSVLEVPGRDLAH